MSVRTKLLNSDWTCFRKILGLETFTSRRFAYGWIWTKIADTLYEDLGTFVTPHHLLDS